MRAPRLRFTVRRVMVAVAILGVCLAGFSAGQRAVFCLREARRYAAVEREELRLASLLTIPPEVAARLRWEGASAGPARGVGCGNSDPETHRRFAAEAGRLSRFYRRAALRFWGPVPPEPRPIFYELPEAIDPSQLERLPAAESPTASQDRHG